MNHITLAVRDIEISFTFYKDVLGLTPVVKWSKGAYLKAGDFWIALNQDPKITNSRRADSSHVAFTCPGDNFPGVKASLISHGCREWSENTSEGASFYFLDPDGHQLEIHVGSLQSRLDEMRNNPWDTFEYF